MASKRQPPKTSPTTLTETYPVVDGSPLRYSFVPEAIREHFPDNQLIQSMEDATLEKIGAHVLDQDGFNHAVHVALVGAVMDTCGFDPNVRTHR